MGEIFQNKTVNVEGVGGDTPVLQSEQPAKKNTSDMAFEKVQTPACNRHNSSQHSINKVLDEKGIKAKLSEDGEQP